MNFKELQGVVKIEAESATINGVEISADVIIKTLQGRIWKSAIVVKNKREADKGGIKLVVSQALQAGLIDATQGLGIILSNDKAQAEALKKQLPQTEKSDEPSDEDVRVAIAQVLANGGQMA